MRIFVPAGMIAVCFATGASAQGSTTTCSQVLNTTYCNTQPTTQDGPLGKFMRGYENARAARQSSPPPPPPAMPSAPPVAEPAPPADPAAPFLLACRFNDGVQTLDKNLEVDPGTKSVNGHPAAFSADSIAFSFTTESHLFKVKARHDVSVNRLTGSVTMADAHGRVEALGACVPVARRMF